MRWPSASSSKASAHSISSPCTWASALACSGHSVVADGTDYATASFTLADGVAATLVDETDPAYVGGMPLALTAVGGATAALLNAYRSGAGVAVDAYGPEMVHAQAAFNRPLFVNELATSWIPQMAGVHARLSDTTNPARVADIGCGCGWSAIELGKAFDHVSIDGYDADPEAIDRARHNALEHGVDDRVRFHLVDASSESYGGGEYDVVFFFECVHDFGRPVEALAAARAAVVPGGAVIVMDERAGDHPQIGDPVETFFALVSATWCLPQSRVVPGCEAPGTVMRAATLESFARRAGWAGVDVLPIEHTFFRFYRLID